MIAHVIGAGRGHQGRPDFEPAPSGRRRPSQKTGAGLLEARPRADRCLIGHQLKL